MNLCNFMLWFTYSLSSRGSCKLD